MRRLLGFLLAIALLGGCSPNSQQLVLSGVGGQKMNDIQVERTKSDDEESPEEWARVTTEPELLGVYAVRISDGDWPWQVHVSVMEFIRTEPLESELSEAVTAALSAVSGVTKAGREDREQWAIQGNAEGPSLVRAVSSVVDQFAPRTRKTLDQLDSSK